MDRTSTRKMSRLNRTRALIRIVKELQYILSKTPEDTPEQRDLRRDLQKTVYHATQAIQSEA